MKKILVVFLVIVAFAANVFAEKSDKYTFFSKMNNEQNFNGLVSYLDADYSQSEQLKLVFSMTEDKINSALKINNLIAAEKALDFNLGNVKIALSEEQYRKYLIFVNVSINNSKETLIAEI